MRRGPLTLAIDSELLEPDVLEDLNDGQLVGSVRVQSPFAERLQAPKRRWGGVRQAALRLLTVVSAAHRMPRLRSRRGAPQRLPKKIGRHGIHARNGVADKA